MRNLFWLCLAAVVYASLYPFNFVIPEMGDVDMAEVFSANSLGDVATNVLAFGLVGILARLSARGGQHQARVLMALAIVLSVLAQVLQIFVPGRYPGLLDIIMNLVGLALGFRLAPSAAAFLRHRADFRLETPGPVALLTALFLAGQLFPFFPALRISAFKQNYWSMLSVAENVDWPTIAEYAVSWFVLIFLLGPLVRGHRLRALIFIAPIALFCVRLLIMGNVANVWQLIGGCLGVAMILALQKFGKVLPVAILLIAALIIWQGLVPFAPRMVLMGTSLPFLQESLPSVIWKTYLYGSLIYLMWQSGFAKGPSTVAVAALLLLLEIFQTHYASGTPQLAGPLLAILSGLVLARIPPLVIQPAKDLGTHDNTQSKRPCSKTTRP